MTFNKLTIVTLLFASISYAQQIGDGYAPEAIVDFSYPLKSGVYEGHAPETVGLTPDNGHSWQHLFTTRHSNAWNNHQLQIASSFAVNDRLFFRKIVAGSLVSSNSPWLELATRGTNSFTGDQVVNGGISSSISNNTGGHLQLMNPLKTANGIGQRWAIYNMTGVYGNGLQFWIYDNLGCNAGGLCENRFTIMDNGNVGIGVMLPNNKLDVNGTIHSKEVKVDMTGWSDFVFKKEYNLPTLEEVEKHIAEKGHLENIPSEEEVLKNGINLGEMNAKLLQKIEELTLYMIEMKKENIDIKKQNDITKNENDLLRRNQIELEKRIEKIEKK
ncbi:hypothetical protein ACWA1F_13275 [Flavobacterium sp. 3-218]